LDRRSRAKSASARAAALAFEQCSLSFDTPLVSTERTIIPNNAMTRNDNRDSIACAGLRDRARRSWIPQVSRDLAVRPSPATWNLSQ
jgi:hypothetical protein